MASEPVSALELKVELTFFSPMLWTVLLSNASIRLLTARPQHDVLRCPVVACPGWVDPDHGLQPDPVELGHRHILLIGFQERAGNSNPVIRSNRVMAIAVEKLAQEELAVMQRLFGHAEAVVLPAHTPREVHDADAIDAQKAGDGSVGHGLRSGSNYSPWSAGAAPRQSWLRWPTCLHGGVRGTTVPYLAIHSRSRTCSTCWPSRCVRWRTLTWPARTQRYVYRDREVSLPIAGPRLPDLQVLLRPPLHAELIQHILVETVALVPVVVD